MELALAAPHPRLSRGPPPEPFVRALRNHLSPLPATESGIGLRVVLDNTVAMSSSAFRRGDKAVIVLDWAQVERALLFFDFVWSRLGRPDAADALFEFFKREILFSGARSALRVGRYVHAREVHRIWAENGGSTGAAANLDEPGAARAVRIAAFILNHEIGHQICRDDPSLPRAAFDAFQQHHRKLVSFTPLRGEELFCDRWAIAAAVAGKSAAEVVALAPEICLVMLNLELWTVVSLFSHVDEHNPSALGRDTAIQLIADRVFRSDQALNLLIPVGGSSRVLAAYSAWRILFEALQQALEEALIKGVEMMTMTSWGEFEHFQSCIHELMNGLPPEAEAAILADIRGYG